MPAQHFGKHAAKIGGDGEVTPVVPLLGRETGPPPVDAAAPDRPTEHEHGVAVAVIGSAAAILDHRPAELRHGEYDDVVHAIAEVAHQGGKTAGEIVQPGCQLAGGRTLI